MESLVSVVIPCYNSHAFLEQTVRSVQAQTYTPIEIVVIDDGSNAPETLALLARLAGEVRLVRQANGGLPAARNSGFREAAGEFVLPLDADDWLEPDAVTSLVQALRAAPEKSFAFAHMQMEGEGRGILRKDYNRFEQLFLNQLPYCLLLRKSAWREVGGYDESMRRGYEDWEFNIRLGGLGYRGVVVPRPLFHYRIAQAGMLLSMSTKLHAQLWSDIRRRHRGSFGWPALIRTWREWKYRPSTYPLWIYFPWLAMAQLLPDAWFSPVFKLLRRFSHGRRVTAAQS